MIIQPVLSFILSIIFLILAILHYYWLLDGQWALKSVLPAENNGRRVLKPGKLARLVLSTGLSLFAIIYLRKSSFLTINIPAWLNNYSGWIISTIFLFRAIGDFKYFAFSKKIKSTKFSDLDTKIYSPLCLLIAFSGFLIELL